ncbi:hypothetical protein J6590_076546 [Homalodisca vitripennis]|nr:hypothetical protein J6590_076546 [Homalodisca vitripennis]
MVKIKVKQQALYVMGTYRSHGSIEESLEVISLALQAAPSWSCPTILMGDINIDCLEPCRDQNDTVLLLSDSTPQTLEVSAHIATEMAVQYCHNNNLIVNETKSKQLVMGRKKGEVGLLPKIEAVDEAST